MQMELYVNKKFDILKIINLVLKRKDWGKTYTLYKTTTHEVLTRMSSYNFNDRYATFDIKINEIHGSGYYSSQVNIYTDREDYTLDFINRLFIKTIISTLNYYRKNIFENEAHDLFPYVYRNDKSDEEWIKTLNLTDKVNDIKNTTLSDDDKDNLIDLLIDRALSDYENEVTYIPRDKYVEQALQSNRESSILDLIDELKNELDKKESYKCIKTKN